MEAGSIEGLYSFGQNVDIQSINGFGKAVSFLKKSMKTERKVEPILIPVSIGEIFDKKTILEIKSERMSDLGKLAHVRTELALLTSIALALFNDEDTSEELAALQDELLEINKTLWDLENKVRALDRVGDYGPDFVTSARAIYSNNDRRAAVKRRINNLLGSKIVEEKEHG